MIKVRGSFVFVYRVPTFKELWCILKTGEKVEADFNNLEIDSPGNVWVAIKEKKIKKNKGGKEEEIEKKYFVKISLLLPQKEEDNKDFDFFVKEINQISLKRKHELKLERKQKTHEKINVS